MKSGKPGSMSQALDWIRQRATGNYRGLIEFWKQEAEQMKNKPPRYEADSLIRA